MYRVFVLSFPQAYACLYLHFFPLLRLGNPAKVGGQIVLLLNENLVFALLSPPVHSPCQSPSQCDNVEERGRLRSWWERRGNSQAFQMLLIWVCDATEVCEMVTVSSYGVLLLLRICCKWRFIWISSNIFSRILHAETWLYGTSCSENSSDITLFLCDSKPGVNLASNT